MEAASQPSQSCQKSVKDSQDVQEHHPDEKQDELENAHLKQEDLFIIKISIDGQIDMDKQSVASSLLKIVASHKDKLIVFKGFEGIEESQGQKHLLFKKIGVNMDRWIGMNPTKTNNKISLPFRIKAVIQIIEIAEILQNYSLSFADLISQQSVISSSFSSLSIDEEGQVFMIPQVFNEKNLKQQVFHNYLLALSGKGNFFYSPEILVDAINCGDREKSNDFFRNEKVDVWCVGIILLLLLGKPKNLILQLVNESKNSETQRFLCDDAAGLITSIFLKKVFAYDPDKRWNLKILKKELLSMASQLEASERLKNKPDKKNSKKDNKKQQVLKVNSQDIKLKDTGVEDLKDMEGPTVANEIELVKKSPLLEEQLKIDKQNNLKMINYIQTDEDDINLKNEAKQNSILSYFIQIKECLGRIMYLISYWQKKSTSTRTADHQKQINQSYLKALIDPFSVNLIDFLWYSGQQAQILGKQKLAKELLDDRKNLVRAFIESGNGKQALELSKCMLFTDSESIETLLVAAECKYQFGNTASGQSHVDKILQSMESKNMAALFLKGKLNCSSLKYDKAESCFFKCLEAVNNSAEENISNEFLTFPCYPSKDQINFEIGKIFSIKGCYEKSDGYFVQSIAESSFYFGKKFLGSIIEGDKEEISKELKDGSILDDLGKADLDVKMFELMKIQKFLENRIKLLKEQSREEKEQKEQELLKKTQLESQKKREQIKKYKLLLKTVNGYLDDLIQIQTAQGLNLNEQTEDEQEYISQEKQQGIMEQAQLFTRSVCKWVIGTNLKYKIITSLQEVYSKPKQKISLLEEAIILLPQSSYLHLRLAHMLIKQNITNEAHKHIKITMSQDPGNILALFMLAKLTLKLKVNVKLSQQLLMKCAGYNAKFKGIQYFIGIAYYKQNKYQKAIECFQQSQKTSEEKQKRMALLMEAKSNLFLGNTLYVYDQFLRYSQSQSQGDNMITPNAVFYKGVCKFKKSKEIEVEFAENLDYLKSQRKKLITVKICLRQYLDEGSEEKFRKLEALAKINQKNGIVLDNDALALFSEASLFFGVHPQVVAMRYVQQGMIVNDITLHSTEDNSPVVEPHFGCLIQGIKIMYQLQTESEKDLETLLEKAKNLIKQFQGYIDEKRNAEGIFPIPKSDAQDQNASFKESIKQSWCQQDWSITAYLLLAHIYISLKRYPEAEKISKEITDWKCSFQQKEIKHLAAVLFLNQNNIKEGRAAFIANKEYAPSCFFFGKYQSKRCKQTDGITYIQNALKINPHNLTYLKALGEIAFSVKAFTTTNDAYEKYIEELTNQNKIISIADLEMKKLGKDMPPRQIPLDYQLLTQYGESLYVEKKSEQSQVILEKSLKLNPNQPRALYWSGKIALDKSGYSEAKRLLTGSIHLGMNADTWYLLGECNLHLNDEENAIECFNQAVFFKDDHFMALRSLGDIYFKKDLFEEAQPYFEQCFRIQQDDEIVLFGIGECSWKRFKDQEKSGFYFEKCLQLNPKCDKQFLKIIEFLRAIGKKFDSEFLGKNKKCFERNVQTLFIVGEMFFKDNYLQAGLIIFTQILKSSTISEEPLIMLISHLRSAQIYYIQSKFDESFKEIKYFNQKHLLPVLNQTQKQEKKVLDYDAILLESRLRMYLGKKKVDKGLMKCIKINPDNEQPFLLFALYLWNQNSQNAWKFLEKGSILVNKKAISDSSTNEQVMLLNTLKINKENGDFQESKQQLKSCVFQFPNCQYCYYQLGKMCMEEQQYAEAVEYFEKSQKIPLKDSIQFCLSCEQESEVLCSQATAFIKLNSIKDALASIQKCLDRNPKCAEALLIKSQICFKQGGFSEAIQLAESSILSDSSKASAFNALAHSNMQLGNSISAINSLKKCLAIDPTFPLVCLKLAVLYESTSRPQMALTYFLQHLALNPHSIQALLHSTKLLAYFKKFQAAEQHLKRLFAALQDTSDPNQASTLNSNYSPVKSKNKQLKPTLLDDQEHFDDRFVHLSSAYAVEGYLRKQQQKLSEAIGSYQSSLKLNKSNENVQYSLAEIYSTMENHKKEIKIYGNLIHTYPSSKYLQRYFNNMGNALRKTGQLSEAVRVYTKATGVGQYSQEIIENLAACLIQMKSYNEALTVLSSLKINYETSYFLYGLIYQAKGDTINAIKSFEKAIKVDSSYEPPYLSLAEVKKSQGNLSEAIAICQRSQKSSESHIETQMYLVNCFIKQKDSWAALSLCEQIQAIISEAIKTQETNKQLKKTLIAVNIQITRIYSQLLHEYQKAIDHLKKCLVQSPQEPQYLHELGNVYFQQYKNESKISVMSNTDFSLQNRLVESLDFFKQASKIDPTNLVYQLRVGNILHELGQYNLEIECLHQCLELPSYYFKEQLYNNIAIAQNLLHLKDKASSTYVKALQLFPSSSLLHFNYGNLLFSLREFNNARVQYEECLLIDPSHLGALNNLARACIYLKQFQRVADCYGKCLSISPENKDVYAPKLAILLKKGFYSNNSSTFASH